MVTLAFSVLAKTYTCVFAHVPARSVGQLAASSFLVTAHSYSLVYCIWLGVKGGLTLLGGYARCVLAHWVVTL